MKTWKLTLSLFFALFLSLHAEDIPANIVSQVQKSLPDLASKSVLGVQVSESNGKQVWELQYQDSNFKGDRRAITFFAGKIDSDKARTLKSVPASSEPLSQQDLQSSLAPLRAKANSLAAEAKVTPSTIRYVLCHRPNTAATWRILIFDNKQKYLGRLEVDAATDTLISSVWGKDLSTSAEARSDFEQFGNDVESTFKGIGGDLEQFFTGKRTID